MATMNERPLISNTELSYVISITMAAPTIRIKIPKVFVKAMQRRNSVRSRSNTDSTDQSSSGKSKKKKKKKKKKSFRKKVGAIFSNVFGGNKKSAAAAEEEVCSNGANGAVGGDGHVDHRDHDHGVQETTAVATGFGVSKPLLANQVLVVAAEEGTAAAGAVLKVHSKRTIGLELKKLAKGDEVDGSLFAEDGSLSSIFVNGERNPNAVGTRSKLKLKLKLALSMKKMMGGEAEE